MSVPTGMAVSFWFNILRLDEILNDETVEASVLSISENIILKSLGLARLRPSPLDDTNRNIKRSV